MVVECCICDHGKAHHQGEYGECTHPSTPQRNHECLCQAFTLKWIIDSKLEDGIISAERYHRILEGKIICNICEKPIMTESFYVYKDHKICKPCGLGILLKGHEIK